MLNHKYIYFSLFILIISSVNVAYCGGDRPRFKGEHDFSEFVKFAFADSMFRNQYKPNGNTYRLSKVTKKNFLQVTADGMKGGLLEGIISTTRSVVEEVLRPVPSTVVNFGSLIKSYLYRMSFGSPTLTCADLAKINNLIYNRCSPFASISAGNMDARRRGILIKQDQDQVFSQDEEWDDIQESLIRELSHGITFLKNALPHYDLKYLQTANGGLRSKLARMLHSFSLQYNEQISFYMLRTIFYIDKLIELFSSFNSLEEAQQKYELTKRWLSWTCNSFEQIALFLEDGTAQTKVNRGQFLKPSGQNSGNMPALVDSLLGGNSSLPMGALQ